MYFRKGAFIGRTMGQLWGASGVIGMALAAPMSGCTPEATSVSADSGRPPGQHGALVADVWLTSNPEPSAPLVPLVHVETAEPTTVTVRAEGAGDVLDLEFTDVGRQHEIPLLGLVASEWYDVTVEVIGMDGRSELVGPLPMRQADLPPDVPVPQVDVSIPERTEPGYILIGNVSAATPLRTYVFALDRRGRVVWCWEAPARGISDIQTTERGTLLVILGFNGSVARNAKRIVEIDLRGRVLGGFVPQAYAGLVAHTPVDLESVHHEIEPGPDGTLFTLAPSLTRRPLYPSDELDPTAPLGPASVVIDHVVQIGPDGQVLDDIDLSTVLDPARIGYDSVKLGYWDEFYGVPTSDWAHANAVQYDEATDDLIVSSRHQDAVVRFDRVTRAIKWIVAPDANWREPWASRVLQHAPDAVRSYHQHAPVLTSSGTLMMFDNGNRRASAFETPLPPSANASRAVEYRIDEASGRIEELWSYGFGRQVPVFSASTGNATPLPETGNVLVVFGDIEGDQDEASWRVVEVTHTDPPEVVLELARFGEDELIRLYRAHKVPTLYGPECPGCRAP